jgi:hypothetical protein
MKTRQMALVICLLAVFLVACQPGTQQTETQAPEGKGPEAGKGTGAGRGTGAGGGKKTEARAEETVTVPAGTELAVRLVEGIDTGKVSEGASFEGTLAAALVVAGVEAAPVGSKVAGKVTSVVSSGRLNRPAELSLVLTSLTTKDGETVEISTNTWSLSGESHKKRNIEMIGGGAAAGAVIGALTGGKKGAAIGGAVGAGGGTGVAAATGKKEIQLAPETKLSFKLTSPVTIALQR